MSLACLCGCRRIRTTRGLSLACYARVFRAVRAGLTTWAKLEKAGKVLPRRAPYDGVRTRYQPAGAI